MSELVRRIYSDAIDGMQKELRKDMLVIILRTTMLK